MNSGTARKWIDAINSGKYVFDCSQMRSSETRFDAFDVLADFLDPDGWKLLDEIDYAHYLKTGIATGVSGYCFHEQTHVLPESFLKRCKLKSQWMEFELDNSGEKMDMSDVMFNTSHGPGAWDKIVYYIEKYHPQF